MKDDPTRTARRFAGNAFVMAILLSCTAALCGCFTMKVLPPERLHGQELAPNTQAVGHIKGRSATIVSGVSAHPAKSRI